MCPTDSVLFFASEPISEATTACGFFWLQGGAGVYKGAYGRAYKRTDFGH